MKTPVNMKNIRQHLAYAWWKYLLLFVLAIFGWNIIYTVTEYQPPADKKVDVFAFTYGNDDLLSAYMEQIRTTEMSDMEAMDAFLVGLDETYSAMQLSTYMAAGEGHLYILPKEYFQSYAKEGAFMPLENLTGLMDTLSEAGISLDRGWRTLAETGENHLYGIPLAKFPGFASFFYNYDDLYISIAVFNGNDANSEKFLQLFLTDMLEEPIAIETAN